MGVVFEGFRVVVANRAEDGAHPFRGVGEENSDQLADNIAIDFVFEFQKLAQYSWVDWLLCGRVLRLVPGDGIFVALVIEPKIVKQKASWRSSETANA